MRRQEETSETTNKTSQHLFINILQCDIPTVKNFLLFQGFLYRQKNLPSSDVTPRFHHRSGSNTVAVFKPDVKEHLSNQQKISQRLNDAIVNLCRWLIVSPTNNKHWKKNVREEFEENGAKEDLTVTLKTRGKFLAKDIKKNR